MTMLNITNYVPTIWNFCRNVFLMISVGLFSSKQISSGHSALWAEFKFSSYSCRTQKQPGGLGIPSFEISYSWKLKMAVWPMAFESSSEEKKKSIQSKEKFL